MRVDISISAKDRFVISRVPFQTGFILCVISFPNTVTTYFIASQHRVFSTGAKCCPDQGSNPNGDKIFRTRHKRVLEHSQPSVQGFPGICSRNISAGMWRYPPTSPSANVKEGVELYLYSLSLSLNLRDFSRWNFI
jgi:hypothetical protein